MTSYERLALALSAMAIVLSGCGGDGESPEDRIADRLAQLQDDLKAGKLGAVCASMTARPARQIGTIGHGTEPTTCPRDLTEMLRQLEQSQFDDDYPTLDRAPRPSVADVAIDASGRTATAVMSIDGRRFDVRMREQRGKWKLDDFFGADDLTPKAFQ